MNSCSFLCCYSNTMLCCFDQADVQSSCTLQVQVDSSICAERYLWFYLRHLHMKYEQLLTLAVINYGSDIKGLFKVPKSPFPPLNFTKH